MAKEHTKTIAHLCLAAATVVFVGSLFLPANGWVDFVRAVSEAAMVGALADWFAVSALFRRVPIPFLARHTNIIASNKARIADNLAMFVRDKFFNVDALTALLRKHDPALIVAQWLAAPQHMERLGRHLLTFAGGILKSIDEAPIHQFVEQAVHAALAKVDFSRSAGVILETLTQDGRHQALLDEALDQFATLLRNEEAQNYIENGIVQWLKVEHPIKEKVLPSEWIGKNGAQVAVKAVSRLLDEINNDPQHGLRIAFDAYTQRFITRLKTDPDFKAKGEVIKQGLQEDSHLNQYLRTLWHTLRDWLLADLAQEDSKLHQQVVAGGRWLGETISNDATLRSALNQHIETAAQQMTPDFAAFISTHISDTVKQWNDADMAQQIEASIGRDLQFIRINGTLVGGLIGAVLYGLHVLAGVLR